MTDKAQRAALISRANEARKNAYAPYSHFRVGAALLTADGRIYAGCNVENASFTPTCCAERVALFSAIADGAREFSAIALVGNNPRCMPCGVCRQSLSEFTDGSMTVLFYEGGARTECTLAELLPHGFTLK